MTWHAQHKDSLSLGQRAADIIRDGMGSWLFVGCFCFFMCVWAVLNVTIARPFDPYPFILLNLMLSTLAGLQGAILLIAARRQDEVSAALAQHDLEVNERSKEEIEELLLRLDKLEIEKLDKIISLLEKV